MELCMSSKEEVSQGDFGKEVFAKAILNLTEESVKSEDLKKLIYMYYANIVEAYRDLERDLDGIELNRV